jgi:hypothetical protein
MANQHRIEVARLDHRAANADFIWHINHCRVCGVLINNTGTWCQIGRDLERDADTAGNRWEALEES